MSYMILDEDEYEVHKKQMNYPEVIDQILHNNLDRLLGWIKQRRGPFAPDFIEVWTQRYEFHKQVRGVISKSLPLFGQAFASH